MSIAMLRRFACLAVVVAAYTGYPGLAAAAKPNTVTAVPLKVTVLDFDSVGNPCQICSDGLGPYISGVDNVAANLDRYGNLIIDFGRINNQEIRELRFDYSRPVDPNNSYPTPPVQVESYLSTITHPGGFIQSMDVGAQQCVQLTISFVDGDGLYHRNIFQRPTGDVGDVSQTSYLVVTHTDANTWEAEPKEAPCNTGVPLVGKMVTGPDILGPFTDRGHFYLPFKMILERR